MKNGSSLSFEDLRSDPTLKKVTMEVSVVYIPATFDRFVRLKDKNNEIVDSFIEDIKQRQKFLELHTEKKKVLVEIEIYGEYPYVTLIESLLEEKKENQPIKSEKKKSSRIKEVITEEIIPEVEVKEPEIVISEEEIKHVRKTIEQEIKESIYKNPINLDLIKENENLELNLSEYGINNTQIFTRRTDIDKMIASIGIDYIKNPATTILEPTSGDGAFTTRILEIRLEAFKEKSIEEFLLLSLKALSTIYSIEYELANLEVQRNNMYTLMIKYLKEHLLTEDDQKYFNSKETKWKKLVKEIIFYNIIWGATSTELDPDYKVSDRPVLGKYRSNDMPIVIRSWDIKKDLKYRFANIT